MDIGDIYIMRLYGELIRVWNPRLHNLQANIRTPEEVDIDDNILSLLFLNNVAFETLELVVKVIQYQQENQNLYSKYAYEDIRILVFTLISKHDDMVDEINGLQSQGFLQKEMAIVYTSFGKRCTALAQIYTSVKFKETSESPPPIEINIPITSQPEPIEVPEVPTPPKENCSDTTAGVPEAPTPSKENSSKPVKRRGRPKKPAKLTGDT